MNITKFQPIHKTTDFLTIDTDKSNKVITDFKTMLTNEIKSTKMDKQNEIDDFTTCKETGLAGTIEFPPKNAPIEFKAIWDEVCGKMDSEEFGLFSGNVTSILQYGVTYPLEYTNESQERAYYASQDRINRLGYAGCVEFILQTQKRHVQQNQCGGNEQKWIDVMQKTVDTLQEIIDKLKELNDPTINKQIISADGEYEMLAAKDDRDGVELAAAMATGMSNEEFQAVMNRITQRQMRVMADGTILTTIMRDGHIINSFRQRLHNNKTLTI